MSIGRMFRGISCVTPMQLIGTCVLSVGMEELILRPMMRRKKYAHGKHAEYDNRVYTVINPKTGDVVWSGNRKELEEVQNNVKKIKDDVKTN